MLLFNIFNFFSMYGYLIALKYGSATIATGLYHGMTIFAVLAGIIFLREREDIWKKVIGSLITIAGVIILTTTG